MAWILCRLLWRPVVWAWLGSHAPAPRLYVSPCLRPSQVAPGQADPQVLCSQELRGDGGVPETAALSQDVWRMGAPGAGRVAAGRLRRCRAFCKPTKPLALAARLIFCGGHDLRCVQFATSGRTWRHAPTLLMQVFKMSEAEVIRCAGVDAAMYLKILRMGAWGKGCELQDVQGCSRQACFPGPAGTTA